MRLLINGAASQSKAEHKAPTDKQAPAHCQSRRFSVLGWFSAFASLGMDTMLSALVKMQGSINNGIAMPFSMPRRAVASAAARPLA